MLSAYIVGLKAYYIQLGRKQGSKRPSLDGWDRALQSADRALAAFREAEVQRKDGDLDSAMRPLIKLFLHYRRGILSSAV